ncbi:MAG TPA: inositol monophosphatase family protein [Candidatus Saccharimonadales bacterium]|nr:inositol monophosphatase family protein [Candidatus Saccharimonadales bacterium]
MQTLSEQEITEVVTACERAFRDVRPFILERAGKDSTATDKTDGSPVTESDKAVEAAIMAALASTGVPVYGEETGYDEHVDGTFVLIDPIDGTRDFIENVPHFTNMAVLITDGAAVAAVIHNVTTGDMYTCRLGAGAYKNGKRLQLADMPLPPIAYCKREFMAAIAAIIQPVGVTPEPAPRSGGFGFAMVAEGVAAARFNLRSGGYIHDYAPGGLLVREAGGVLVPVADDKYTYKTRSFVACHPALAPVLTAHIAQLRQLETPQR